MKGLIEWVKRMHREHGPIVSIIAALAVLLIWTLMLATVFAIFGILMWIEPYLAVAVGIVVVLFLIKKRY
jgi:hypothetical protein